MNTQMLDGPGPPEEQAARVPRLSSVVARLSLSNALVAAAGFITGPLLARALGPTGRGEFAAIIVPFVLAPQILGLALGAYAAREAASGRRTVSELAGSLGLVLLLIGALGIAGAEPAAAGLASGNDTVETYLTIGFLILPVGLLGGLAAAIVAGLERWTLVIVTKLVAIGIPLLGIVCLYILDELSVGRAAALTMLGAVVSAVPAFAVIARAGRPVFRKAVAKESIVFGLRSWIGFLAQLSNARLDQLLMITLVSSRELGFYAVAVSLASVSTFLSGALGPPVIARVAKGETAIVARGLRVTLAAITAMNIALAAVTPVLLPLLFGSAFKDAIDQTLVLLIASIPLAGISLITPALMAHGAPGTTSLGETIALAITIPGLVILVPELGGLGAAVVSLAAYSANFAYQLVVVRRRLGGTLASYLLVHREDLRWARTLVPSIRLPRR